MNQTITGLSAEERDLIYSHAMTLGRVWLDYHHDLTFGCRIGLVVGLAYFGGV